ncbi:MAG: hypothetical protein OXC13_15840 [Caldilineaceae bacterium]|nr:hypothetical protein [Caldilineaceae bacterium]
MKRNRTEGVQPGLFEGPPAGPVANPAPRPGVPEAPPPAPTLRFSGVYREGHPVYGDNIQFVDIKAVEAGHTWAAGRLVRGVPRTDHDGPDAWICEPDPDEPPGFLPELLDEDLGPRLRDAKRAVVAWVRAWADA